MPILSALFLMLWLSPDYIFWTSLHEFTSEVQNVHNMIKLLQMIKDMLEQQHNVTILTNHHM